MKYRVRNLRTDVVVHPEETYALANADDLKAEWVLECEGGDGAWFTSGYHVRDLLGVKDPKPFDEVFAVCRAAV